MATKLRALRGWIAKREVELTLDIILKGVVRRPLWRANILSILLSLALLPVGVNKPLKATKIIHVLVVVTVVRTLAAMKTSFVTTEIRIVAISGRGLMLGYICRGWQRWCGQQRTIDNHWLKKGIVKKLMRKEMAMNVCIWKRFCLDWKAGYQVFKLTMKNTKHI
jgi:hypothetical protein